MADDIRTCADLDQRRAPYVDGEDAPVWRRAVDAHLAKCPPCRAGVEAETAAREIVRGHREVLAERAPDALRARCEASFQLPATGSQLPATDSQLSASGSRLSIPASQLSASRFPSRLRKWVPLSLAATLVLAVAGVFLFGLNDRVQALTASLAMDHNRCFKAFGTSTDVEPAVAERAWQQDQRWPIVVPPSEPQAQLKLVNVRKCLTTEGWSAHMMYSWGGEPLSVYVLQGDAGRERVVHKLGVRAAVWCANQRTYVVVASDTVDLRPEMLNYMKARVR